MFEKLVSKIQKEHLGLFFIIIGVLFGVAGGILAFALHPSATYLIGYWIGVAGFLFCALGVVLNFVINSTEGHLYKPPLPPA